jgi:hypothetical protein
MWQRDIVWIPFIFNKGFGEHAPFFGTQLVYAKLETSHPGENTCPSLSPEKCPGIAGTAQTGCECRETRVAVAMDQVPLESAAPQNIT